MIIAVAAVLAAQRFRGGTAPDEIGRRYLSGVQRGDTVALLWLMPPGREQPDAIGERISRYRGISNERIETEYVTHGVASYIKFACVSVGGAPFDEVVLTQMADRWYLANVPKAGSAYCRQAGRSAGPGFAVPSVFPNRVGDAHRDATSRRDPFRGALRRRPTERVRIRHVFRTADRTAAYDHAPRRARDILVAECRGHAHRAS